MIFNVLMYAVQRVFCLVSYSKLSDQVSGYDFVHHWETCTQTITNLMDYLIVMSPSVYKGCDDNSWVKHFMYRPCMIVLDVLHHLFSYPVSTNV